MDLIKFGEESLKEYHDLKEEYRKAWISYVRTFVRENGVSEKQYYHLHPDYIDEKEDFWICSGSDTSCKTLMQTKNTIPPYSIKQIDFGNPDKFDYVKALTIQDHNFISKIRLFTRVYKLESAVNKDIATYGLSGE